MSVSSDVPVNVPAAGDFRLAGLASIVRASLGLRNRGEAHCLARQAATFCDAVFALAAASKEATCGFNDLNGLSQTANLRSESD